MVCPVRGCTPEAGDLLETSALDTHSILIALATVIVVGVAAQWLAWRLRVPSILLLLVLGFVVGETGILDPEAVFGNMLFPFVSLAVAIILFEGGMNLHISEIHKVRGVVGSLVSVGLLVTWILSALAARYVLDMDWHIAILFGALLTVTGPTVILPLLRLVRPKGNLNSILKWEGILIDPLGVVLGVLVLEHVLASGHADGAMDVALHLGKTAIIGMVMGAVGAASLVLVVKKHLAPDYMQNPIALVMVIFVYTLSNTLSDESGLLAVTIMGMGLSHQRTVDVRHIVEFKENLRVLLLSMLFIVLAARLQLSMFADVGWRAALFLAVLILVIRPASVFLSSLRSTLNWRERVFLSSMAPRGIVAAAVTSLFALQLEAADVPGGERLVPLMFLVIVGTISIYGLAAAPMARLLNVASPSPQGCVIVGAHALARAIGVALQKAGFATLLIDTNRGNIAAARLDGLQTYYGSVLSDHLLDEIELDGIGRLLALTPNEEINTLAALYMEDVFDSSQRFQLAVKNAQRRETLSSDLTGKILFDGSSYPQLARRLNEGASIKLTRITEEFTFEAFLEQNRHLDPLPLFVVREGAKEGPRLQVCCQDTTLKVSPGQTVISLIGVRQGNGSPSTTEPGDSVAGYEPATA